MPIALVQLCTFSDQQAITPLLDHPDLAVPTSGKYILNMVTGEKYPTTIPVEAIRTPTNMVHEFNYNRYCGYDEGYGVSGDGCYCAYKYENSAFHIKKYRIEPSGKSSEVGSLSIDIEPNTKFNDYLYTKNCIEFHQITDGVIAVTRRNYVVSVSSIQYARPFGDTVFIDLKELRPIMRIPGSCLISTYHPKIKVLLTVNGLTIYDHIHNVIAAEIEMPEKFTANTDAQPNDCGFMVKLYDDYLIIDYYLNAKSPIKSESVVYEIFSSE